MKGIYVCLGVGWDQIVIDPWVHHVHLPCQLTIDPCYTITPHLFAQDIWCSRLCDVKLCCGVVANLSMRSMVHHWRRGQGSNDHSIHATPLHFGANGLPEIHATPHQFAQGICAVGYT